jgi:hypothetical protein
MCLSVGHEFYPKPEHERIRSVAAPRNQPIALYATGEQGVTEAG